MSEQNFHGAAPPASACYLGVDGGGSKTLAVIVDASGAELGCAQAGSSNYTGVGLDTALHHIRQAVEQATQAAGCTFLPRGAWFGLAGVDRPLDHELFYPQLASLASSIRITNDADLAFSALPEMVGVALIAGTGSIVLGRDERGISARAGGWGHIIGDEGSGYDLGRQALRAAARAADGRGPHTLLLDLILRSWELQAPEDLINAVYSSNDKARIAHLSASVFASARESDEVANQLLDQAADELAQAVLAVYHRLDFGNRPLPLALSGGLLLHETAYRERVLRLLRAKLPLGKVVTVSEPALSAARAAISLQPMSPAYKGESA